MSEPGTKAWLVRSAATRAKVPDVVARRVIDAFLDAVKAAVWEKRLLILQGFATFTVRRRRARVALDCAIPAAEVVKVRASAEWRARSAPEEAQPNPSGKG